MLLEKLDELETKEQKEIDEGKGGGGDSGVVVAVGKSKKGKGKGGKGMVKADTLPSKDGIRIEPIVGEELKDKVVKAAALKEKKATIKKEGKGGILGSKVKDEFDDMVDEATASGKKKTLSKQTTLAFQPVEGSIKANPWSEEDADDISDFDKSSDGDLEVVQPKAKQSRLVSTEAKKGYAEVSLI